MPLPKTDPRIDRIADILNRLAGVAEQRNWLNLLDNTMLLAVNYLATQNGVSPEEQGQQMVDSNHPFAEQIRKAQERAAAGVPVFDRTVAEDLLDEMEAGAVSRLLDSRIPSTALQRAGIASRAADAIIAELEAALSTGVPTQPVATGDFFLDITSDSFYQKALQINRFRDRPLRAMQMKDVLNGLVTAGITTQEVIDRITRPRLDREGDIIVDAETEAALGILANVETNWPTLINAVAQRDEPDFGQAIQEVLGSDLGLDLFPALTPDEIQRQLRDEADIDRLGLDENGNLRSVKDLVDEQFGNPARAINERAKEVRTQANRQMTEEMDAFRAGLPRGWSEKEIAAATVRELLRRKQLGDYDVIEADVGARIEADFVSSPENALKRLTDFSFKAGIDLDTITDARENQLARTISQEGALTNETAQGFLKALPDLQAEKSNEDFLKLTPEKRQGALLGELSAQGFQSPFGDAQELRRRMTEAGTMPKKGTFADARLKALVASQSDFLAGLDQRAQQAIQANPFARLGDVVRPQFQAGEAGVGLEGAGGLAAFGRRQPTMEGALPFQIPGSFSEQQQFGANPPNPAAAGIPGLATPPGFTAPVLRQRLGTQAQPQISADEARRLISRAAGGDADFESYLLENLPTAFTSAQTALAGRQARSFERQKERDRENRTRNLANANALLRQGVPAQQVSMLSSRTRDTRTLSLSRFIQSPERIAKLRTQFEQSPQFASRLESERRRRLRGGLSVFSGMERF